MAQPIPTSLAVSKRMARHPRRDTLPELRVRRILHSRGLRYRVDFRPVTTLRCRADIVFRGPRIAVFIDGCYWHGCPEHCRLSGQNAEWWRRKIDRTTQRDMETDRALEASGWSVVRAWAHEDPDIVADLVEARIRGNRMLLS